MPSRLTPRALAASCLVLVACALVALAHGCHPQLPPASGCAPRTYRCDADRPAVCSASGRWEPIGDAACSAVGGVCVADPVAHCAPASDAGSGGAP